MDIEKIINEKIQRLQDLNKEMQKLNNEIGALQEKGRALHGAALQLKGAIEGLAEAKAKADEELKTSETAKLTLPVGVKPIVSEVAATEAPKAEAPATTLEVVQ